MRGDVFGNIDICIFKFFIFGFIFFLIDKDLFNVYIFEIEFVYYIIIINV